MVKHIIKVASILVVMLFAMKCFCQETNPPSGGIKGNETEKSNSSTEQMKSDEDSTKQESTVIDKNQRSTRRKSQADSQTENPTQTVKKTSNPDGEKKINTNKSALTIGILQGGGSLIGADFERLVYKNIGIQIGAGFIGVGAALNIHFSPTINSSFISLGYWGQGISGTLSQLSAGPTFVYRGDWFTAQIGIGYILSRGSELEQQLKETFNTDDLPKVMALYSIGIYFDFE